MRNKLLLGNWKMNMLPQAAANFVKSLKGMSDLARRNNIELGLAPTFVCLKDIRDIQIREGINVIISAQNCHYEDNGAFTGEISVPMLKAINIEWSIVGHSERRTYYNETNQTCNLKILKLLKNNMVPVYCVGETLTQFENNETSDIVKTQIIEGLKGVSKEEVANIVFAYEPIWSIGTGKNASKEIAENVCALIRSIINDLYGEVSEEVRILYGGSVKPENVKAYLTMPNIDGALIGGASLHLDSYRELLLKTIAED